MELVADLRRFAVANPGARRTIDTLIDTVSRIEGEVLIEGGTAPRSARLLSAPHTSYVRAAEDLCPSTSPSRSVGPSSSLP